MNNYRQLEKHGKGQTLRKELELMIELKNTANVIFKIKNRFGGNPEQGREKWNSDSGEFNTTRAKKNNSYQSPAGALWSCSEKRKVKECTKFPGPGLALLPGLSERPRQVLPPLGKLRALIHSSLTEQLLQGSRPIVDRAE